ncbi:MAG: putative toxin-antitoxin system toxin component, PIN family [Balneolaceae bacterium]|nr:putative toxin-antitoxin system toxin component, PIN family [Balneolaceae bacterium]
MKVFADTNFLVSAFATRGLSADIFQLILADHELIIGEFVLAELRRVLLKKLKVHESIVLDAENLLRQHSIEPMPDTKSEIQDRDEDDRWVLQSAINSNADILITGDKDLLVLTDQIKKPKILTPRQFWELVSK